MVLRMFKYVCHNNYLTMFCQFQCCTYSLVFQDDSSAPTMRFLISNKGIEQWFMKSVYEQWTCALGVLQMVRMPLVGHCCVWWHSTSPYFFHSLFITQRWFWKLEWGLYSLTVEPIYDVILYTYSLSFRSFNNIIFKDF